MAWFAGMASRVFLFSFVMQGYRRDEKPVPPQGNERARIGKSLPLRNGVVCRDGKSRFFIQFCYARLPEG